VQGGDLVVEGLPALVETAQPTAHHLVHQGLAHLDPAVLLRGQFDGDLQQVEGTPGIPVGGLGEALAQGLGEHHRAGAESPFGVAEGAVDEAPDRGPVEGLEDVHPNAREQGVVEFERGVLGGGADEDEGAVLDEGQEGVLLGLVEAVHLVHEQHRAAPVGGLCLLGRLHRPADVLDAGEDGGEGEEAGVGRLGDEARQGGLAGPRRAPEDERVDLPALQGDAQGLALPQQVVLSHHLAPMAGAHPIGQRAGAVGHGTGRVRTGGVGEEVVHGSVEGREEVRVGRWLEVRRGERG